MPKKKLVWGKKLGRSSCFEGTSTHQNIAFGRVIIPIMGKGFSRAVAARRQWKKEHLNFPIRNVKITHPKSMVMGDGSTVKSGLGGVKGSRRSYVSRRVSRRTPSTQRKDWNL